ncbi:MAG: hypothetical protein J7500_12765 [Sphingomonas sp.]|uniref:hypothetical protein n=1 Tax=Sphingomonas sp. TaxID=28214 RepID=UPI001B1AFCF3|nr:hypothetical protein [Sphingomonas sp.]MBO9623573.1 hypothetical protein [Sphingomonas sp.]
MRTLRLLIVAAAIVLPAQAMAQSEPARDARGYPVTSNPLPGGLTETVRAPDGTVTTRNVPQDLTPKPSAGNYPPCTREVTDGCLQVHERGMKAKKRARRR